jgi:hypothetical protein
MRPFIAAFPARCALIATFIALSAPQAMLCQSSPAPQKTRSWTDPRIATLMLVDDLGPSDARAVVIRRPGELPNNIILVTRSTTATDLAHAVSALITSRRSRGDAVEREIRALIGATPIGTLPTAARRSSAKSTAGTAKPGKRSPSEAQAASDLERLPRAPEFGIAGIGHGPSLVIRMSDKRTAKP